MANDFTRKEGGFYGTMAKTYPPENPFENSTGIVHSSQLNYGTRLQAGTPIEVLDEGYSSATVRSQTSGVTIQDVPYEYLNLLSGNLPWIMVTSTWLDAFRFYRKKVFKLLPSNELHLRFLDGFICAYPDVTEDEWDSLFGASSYGGWIWDNLIENDRFYRVIRSRTGTIKKPRRKDYGRVIPSRKKRQQFRDSFERRLRSRNYPG